LAFIGAFETGFKNKTSLGFLIPPQCYLFGNFPTPFGCPILLGFSLPLHIHTTTIS